MRDSCAIHAGFMRNSQDSCGIHAGFMRDSRRIHAGILGFMRESCGIHAGFLRFMQDSCRDSGGNSCYSVGHFRQIRGHPVTFGAILGAFRASLAASLDYFGVSFGHFGSILGHLWICLEVEALQCQAGRALVFRRSGKYSSASNSSELGS